MDLGAVRFVATPAQHFSGRGLADRDASLWASWAIFHGDVRIFFSGDTGYFPGFKQIDAAYGPFDIAPLETGAYDQQWADVHMQTERTLQAFFDLDAKSLLPIHNGTFDLAFHGWKEPLERITALATRRGVSLATPEMGEPVHLKHPNAGRHWWEALK